MVIEYRAMTYNLLKYLVVLCEEIILYLLEYYFIDLDAWEYDGFTLFQTIKFLPMAKLTLYQTTKS